jgi:hypothetical protein
MASQVEVTPKYDYGAKASPIPQELAPETFTAGGLMTTLADNKIIIICVIAIVGLLCVVAYLLIKDDKPKEQMSPKPTEAKAPPPPDAAPQSPKPPDDSKTKTRNEMMALLEKAKTNQQPEVKSNNEIMDLLDEAEPKTPEGEPKSI